MICTPSRKFGGEVWDVKTCNVVMCYGSTVFRTTILHKIPRKHCWLRCILTFNSHKLSSN